MTTTVTDDMNESSRAKCRSCQLYILALIALCLVLIAGFFVGLIPSSNEEADTIILPANNPIILGRQQALSYRQLQTPKAPSFLFILVDDVGWSDLSYNGGNAKTPNIDNWALRRPGSVILQDFHSGGTVCSPTRATVLTGRHHFRDCVDNVYECPDMRSCVPRFEFAPSRTFTVGDAVRAAGPEYEGGAYFAGKWHLGSFYNDSEAYRGITSSPITHGFDHMNATVSNAPTVTLNCLCREDWAQNCDFGHYGGPFATLCPNYETQPCCFNYWWDDPLAPHGVTNLTRPTPTDDSLYLADAFSWFLRWRASQQKPFFAQLSFRNCHKPFIGTKDSKESCVRGEACRPPLRGDPPYTAEELDYYACLIDLDNAVGKVLEALDIAGYYDNTMIWLTSDNGPEANCPPVGICQRASTSPLRPKEAPGSTGVLRGRKRDVYEGGHRVPGIISYPAVFGGNAVSWETVTTMDFLPTVMEILSVDRPPEQQSWAMDGRSVLPLLKNPLRFRWQKTSGGARKIGYGYYDPKKKYVNGWGFRYGRWKYVEGSVSCTQDQCRKPQLYDLKKDVGERNDLSTVYPTILDQMKSMLMKWHASILKSRNHESNCQIVRANNISITI